jgi:hypothetical protein
MLARPPPSRSEQELFSSTRHAASLEHVLRHQELELMATTPDGFPELVATVPWRVGGQLNIQGADSRQFANISHENEPPDAPYI